MKIRLLPGLLMAFSFLFSRTAPAASNQILGWNNLGMHCMDSDYSVFSILPPYNTIEAQLIVNGLLVTNGTGYTVTYEAVADPTGSFNSTALGKGNFYDFALPLFRANLPVDAGLLSWGMPGTNNTPQTMLFEKDNEPVPGVFTPVNWFRAEGIPLSPYDNAGKKNPYPLMLLVARNAGNSIIATNQIVLPISDEMDCRACHASGTGSAAQLANGWVWDGIQERDFRLNILRLHDEHEFANHPALYQAALATNKFNPEGLYRNVIADGKPVLCAACHADVALLAGGFPGIPSFTASMHSYHATVMDPLSNVTLDNAANRSACYRCHPGSTTQCLRGAMGGAVATNGILEMQCQSCHGNMTAVGSSARTGWLIEPTCDNCHTGTANHNNGQIRYTSAFDSNGQWRTAVDSTFATQSDTPAAGLSMYRFSAGHGGLQCEACHGSTHAEFPSTHRNDNLRNIQLQGHAGVMIECTACHVTMPNTSTNGPHGMHPVGQTWVGQHADRISSLAGGVTVCQACHGLDYRGTVLSRAQTDRTLTANFDGNIATVVLFRKAIVGCYNCHNGPGNDNINNSVAPTVSNISTNTTNDKSVRMILPAAGSGLTFQIVSQPDNGAVGLSNNVAIYFPDPGFVGTNQFTFAAYNGKNSNLATGTVVVAQGAFSITATGHVPSFYPAGWAVPLAVVATLSNSVAPITYDWDFDDGSPHATNQFPTHVYQAPGLYLWTVVASASGKNAADIGFIQIDDPMTMNVIQSAHQLNLSWPSTDADAVLEMTSELGPNAQWTVVTNIPVATANQFSLSVPIQPGTNTQFFRIRRIW